MYYILCIPRLEKSISKEQILQCFWKFQLGKIEKINIVTNKSENKTAFIYMKEWFNSQNVDKIIKRFDNNQDIKVVYNSPFYWKIVVAK
jgi:hypothetical protein